MNKLLLTEAMLRQYCEPEVLRRGQEYYRQGAVTSLVRRGDMIEAEVEGSDIEPYQVSITSEAGGEIEADCTCPYDWGGWCKHIAAVALACLRDPEQIEEREGLDALLSRLDRDALQSLIQKLVKRYPRLADEIETLSASPGVRKTPAPAASPADFAPVDGKAVRKQVRGILHSLDRMRGSDAYWHVGGVVNQIRRLLADVKERLEVRDGRGAAAMLEAISEEYVTAFEVLDDSDGEVGELFPELGELWTEAVLTAEWTPEERKSWAKKLRGWQREAEDYGVDEGFEAAAEAVKCGWDDPHLRRVLQGEVTEEGAWPGEASNYAEELTAAGLNVLERQGRFEEALNLARAGGRDDRYAALLMKLDRIPEAVAYGLRHFSGIEETHFLAQRLRERGAIEEALRVAEHGLQLVENRERSPYGVGMVSMPATWLRDFALAEGRTDLAIRAAMAALKEAPDVTAYERLHEIAGTEFPKFREELLTRLRTFQSHVPNGAIEIFLYEGLIDAAMAVADRIYDYDLLGRVMEAAAPTHPDQVIAVCRKQAESIMDRGKADLYDHAAEWLARARAAYLAADRKAEWQAYHAELLKTHERKYKLMPLLKNLTVN